MKTEKKKPKKADRFAQCETHWSEHEYPWTPTTDEKTVTQSFAAIRAGLMPTLQLTDAGIEYVIVDVFTKDGQAAFMAEDKRTLSHAEGVSEKISKKRAKARKAISKGTGLKRKVLDATFDADEGGSLLPG